MKLICKEENRAYLEKVFSPFQKVDVVLVEEGIGYQGMCYVFSMDSLSSLLQDLKAMMEKDVHLLGMKDERTYLLSPKDILYVEIFSKESYFYTQTDSYRSRMNGKELEKILQNQFIRISKSMLVNVNAIDYMTPYPNMRIALHLRNQIILIISRTYREAFFKQLKVRD